MSTPTTPLDQVLVGIIRKVQPLALAHAIIGVQPMTGPTGSIYSLSARYGIGSGPFGGCKLLENEDFWLSDVFIVDFPRGHVAFGDQEQVVIWAIQNCRESFNYYSPVIAERRGPGRELRERMLKHKLTPPDAQYTDVWRWAFANQDDAFAFRMRWT